MLAPIWPTRYGRRSDQHEGRNKDVRRANLPKSQLSAWLPHCLQLMIAPSFVVYKATKTSIVLRRVECRSSLRVRFDLPHLLAYLPHPLLLRNP
jgi:hypothetical protein